MIRSVRLRIALFVLAVVALCQVALSFFVLHQLERVQRDDIDALLVEDLAEVEALLGTPQLRVLMEIENARNSKWNETFFEIRDARGGLAEASANLPPGGLEPSEMPVQRGAVGYWEVTHPNSRHGHLRVRVAQTIVDGHTIRVARSLKSTQRTYWRLRQQFGWGILAIAVLATGCAWWVANRSLAPLRRITARASELGGSLEGNLPRTGSGDELDRLAEVLNALLDRARAEAQRMRRLTADAAHALRTPLTAIRGSLEVQLRSVDEHTAAALAPTLEALEELTALINRLLMLERVESRGRSLRVEPVRLDRIASDLVDTLRVVAEEQGIKLVYEGTPAAVRGDPTELRNAIANLLDNCLRHTPQGGRICVRVGSTDDAARVTVSDSGPGLTRGEIERVFERFYSRTASGTGVGLGLPIARAIAEAHGGRLVAVAGDGGRFELELPLDDRVPG